MRHGAVHVAARVADGRSCLLTEQRQRCGHRVDIRYTANVKDSTRRCYRRLFV
jgi:hypothetical protein